MNKTSLGVKVPLCIAMQKQQEWDQMTLLSHKVNCPEATNPFLKADGVCFSINMPQSHLEYTTKANTYISIDSNVYM